MFLKIMYELVLSLWLPCLLLGVFLSSIYFISNPSPIISKRFCRPCPNWKRSNRWCRCKLSSWLVCRCRRQPRQSPPRLDVSFFLYPHYTNHWRCRRGGAHAIDFLDCRWMDKLFSGRKDGYRPWVYEGVSNTARDSFCDDENKYLLKLQRLLFSFTKLGRVENISDLTRRANFLCVHIL